MLRVVNVSAWGRMASLKRVQEACKGYGLAVSRRLMSQWLFVVFRPLTSHDIAVVDLRDIADNKVEELAAQWALADAFET